MKHIEIKNFGNCSIKKWSPETALQIHNTMEVVNWAPWLSASPESLIGRSYVFPEGQLLIQSSNGFILASVSTNRIQWSGCIEELPDWDTVAGDPTTYETTYNPKGNTLTLMSMNVHQEYRKFGLATQLIHAVQECAHQLGVIYIAGSFRPSEFGRYKAHHQVIPFSEYVQKKREDGLPYDPWIRSLTRSGMIPLKVDSHAMTVTLPIDELQSLRETYQPELWQEGVNGVWECGEVGQWTIDETTGLATYQESNLWGIIPGTTGYNTFAQTI